MLINWFTVGAQIINFLILVLLLRRFLYGPIIRVMDEREEEITRRIEEGEKKKKKAEKEEAAYRDLKYELEQKREELVARAEEEAQEWRKELRQKARKEIDSLQEQWKEALERERETFLQDFKIRAGEEIHQVLRRILKDLSGRDLEGQMIGMFLEKIAELPEQEKEKITSALKGPGEKKGIQVSTARMLPEKLQKEVEEEIERLTGDSVEISFGENKDLICGIELRSLGYKVAWNIDDYLETLVEELSEVLTREEEGKIIKEN